MHHRYSDPVRGLLDPVGLPEKGSAGYYSVMAQRDRFVQGRKLSGTATGDNTQLTFVNGNETIQLSSLGYLHYANVSVGTPSLSYLVALDTGSDLFWLPCDCISCVHGYKTKSGKVHAFNIYSPNKSSTSTKVSCDSSYCEQEHCSLANDTCSYMVAYVSGGTVSAGILVEDTLHLITNDNKEKAVDARIVFGCGMVETGSFLEGGAPNGLFGLGMNNKSVPSVLASEGFTANSFSMCFGSNGTGRISFGDKGSSGQAETPFNIEQQNTTYNVSVTKVTVGVNVTNASFTAIFDTGTSFTYLSDPAYTMIAKSFTSQVQEKRHSIDPNIPFEYCYDLSANQQSFETPSLILTMQGGKEFNVTDPIVIVSDKKGSDFYCLALIKSNDENIIGQNFMTGYNIVFDREKMVLGWETSDCYDTQTSSSPASAPQPTSSAPQVTPGSTSSKSSLASSSSSPHLNPFIFTLVISLFIHSSDRILSRAVFMYT